MSNQIQFELAAPEKMAVSKPVVLAGVPGSDGFYGVLAGHVPCSTKVQAGVVELYENDTSKVTDRYFVTGGYCEVTSDRCTVLADEVFEMEDLDAAQIETAISELLAKANGAETDEDRMIIADLVDIQRAKLFAANHK